MIYLTDTEEIKDIILDLTETEILWLDTEVADYNTKNPRLSLIQVLAYPHNLNGDRTYIFDVLDNHELIDFFIQKIMVNPKIVKVFHNAKYDIKLLGKEQVKNIFCTLELAKEIPYYLLPLKKYNLKVLTEYLTGFKNLNKQEQESNWGIRPLSQQQLKYAQMDCVYLAQVYHKLMDIKTKISLKPQQEDMDSLLNRYQEIEEKWLYLDSEKKHLENRIKQVMLAQNIPENNLFKLTATQKTIIKTNIQEIITLVNNNDIPLNFNVILNKDIRAQLGDDLNSLKTDVETKKYYNLKAKN